MNSKKQGAIGVAKAIAYFVSKGYAVFVPVSDCSRYDLIIDSGEKIMRVEVKTTKSANDQVMLRTVGGNQSWGGEVKRLSVEDCDVVFLVNLNNGVEREYTIEELAGRNSITLKQQA